MYLDYQATTPLDPRVAEAMAPYWNQAFGNPHSTGHRFGWEAKEAVDVARGQVADFIGAEDDEIFFVSGRLPTRAGKMFPHVSRAGFRSGRR